MRPLPIRRFSGTTRVLPPEGTTRVSPHEGTIRVAPRGTIPASPRKPARIDRPYLLDLRAAKTNVLVV